MKKKNINSDLTLYFKRDFPKVYSKKTDRKYEVYLGIGGNIGDMFQRFGILLKQFYNDGKIALQTTSPLLKNPPFGYLEQNDFLNGVIKFGTNIPPSYLLFILQRYEKRFGRKRSFKDAPRTLDLDIIFIKRNGKNMKIKMKNLEVPHKNWKERDSVVIPLMYIE
ncbi:MAG: 2-amino-4-hydroxy-6-hydroxymethyldihydropteridine diphosphokinase [Arcobacteraceae bacterium]|jgi:2-amino-4-hydroxy-6-hydroxymethyldihydropteridine diphosphokinase|nr:2-amino-4-hydroxy-6-hydroxymethyldihydropteridine diphosphokinase [Arcobacteraceae bacterium]